MRSATRHRPSAAAVLGSSRSEREQGERLLRLWRAGITRAARAHATLATFPAGPQREQLVRQLRALTTRRERAARELTAEMSSRASEPFDFEQLAGTVHLTTDPALPSSGTGAGPLGLGFLPVAAWIIIGAASIVGVYAMSRELTKVVVDWTRTFAYIALAGGAGFLLYKLVWGPARPAPRPPEYGEAYA